MNYKTLPAAFTSLTKRTEFVWVLCCRITLTAWLKTPGEKYLETDPEEIFIPAAFTGLTERTRSIRIV